MMTSHREALLAWLEAVPFRRQAAERLIAAEETVYLVGGSVRDALLGRYGYDLDVVTEGSAVALGRWLADALGGAFFVMDRAHDVARVVVRQGGAYYHVDLAGLRAKDIEGDLRARDFTINAMAVALRPGLGELLDPTGGLEDLRRGILRAAYARAFADDPLRIVRGVRLAGAFGLRWQPETEGLALAMCEALKGVSAERLRDELFNILGLPSAALALGHPVGRQVLPLILPLEAPHLEVALERMRLLEQALAEVEKVDVPYRAALEEYLRQALAVGRERRQLLKLAALHLGYGAAAPQKAEESARRLRLSRREGIHLRLALQALHDPLWQGAGEPEPLAIYRYYRHAGEAGVSGALLALWAQPEQARDERRAHALLRAWFTQKEALIEPTPLVSGQEIAQTLGLPPGPQVGALLDALREAQASGQVRDRAEARRYLERLIEKGAS